MATREIIPNVFSVGAIDWIRTIFDELIPLPYGTSYNSYIVFGSEKTALIDTVEPAEVHQLLNNLSKLEIKNIDYVIANHAEQDHSGSIPEILKLYPDVKVVTNKKCMTMLTDLLEVTEDKFIVIEDNETLSLGDKTLKFIIAPWVHWPETMFTYVIEDKILFSGDFLGAHIATSDLLPVDLGRAYDAAKRYYAEIMMPFRNHIVKHLEKLDELEINYICPTHGMVYNNPKFILDAYKEWTSENVKNAVIIPYVSMHGSTKVMVEYLINALMDKGISVKPFDLLQGDIGELAMSIIDAATIIIASSTVLGGPHPQAVYGTSIINALRPKTKFAVIVGSYGWGGKMVESLTDMMKNLKVEFFDPVLIKGIPKNENFEKLDELVESIYNKHKSLNIM